MITKVTELRYQYKPSKIFVDGAKVDYIKSLKIQFNENTNYEHVVDQAKKDRIDPDQRMFVCPVNFNEYGKELLGRFQHVVSKGWILIPSSFNELIIQMRTAKFKDNGNLDKDETSNNTYDAFDSARLALMMFPLGERHEA